MGSRRQLAAARQREEFRNFFLLIFPANLALSNGGRHDIQEKTRVGLGDWSLARRGGGKWAVAAQSLPLPELFGRAGNLQCWGWSDRSDRTVLPIFGYRWAQLRVLSQAGARLGDFRRRSEDALLSDAGPGPDFPNQRRIELRPQHRHVHARRPPEGVQPADQ